MSKLLELADALCEAAVNDYLARAPKEAPEARAALEAEVNRVEADAARYRWLRRLDHFAMVDELLNSPSINTLDAAIDAAIGETK